MENYILQTDSLTKTYRRQTAVDGISLAVPRCSVYGLLGPNGAGKSTTLKMLTGIVRPDSGQVFYNGKEWNRRVLDETGALIESPPLYGNLTADENLKVRCLALGLPEKRIDEALHTSGLADTGKKKTRQFSMGMKQRLGIALALLNHPKLLILDEPANGLDPSGIQELRELIRSFPQRGITVILSSHILSEVENTADEIGIIVNGRLGYQGPLPESSESLETLFMKTVKAERIREVQ